MPYRNGKAVPWTHTVKLKDLMVGDDDATPEQLTTSMRAIYKRMVDAGCFADFWRLEDFDSDFEDIDECNELIEEMYDYADDNLIWIAGDKF